MKALKYFDNPERWHEWGIVCVIGLVMTAASSWSNGPWLISGFALLAIGNSIRVVIQEIWIERNGKTEWSSRDFIYDLIMRPLGENLLCFVLCFVDSRFWVFGILAVFLLTYKWKWFRG